MRISDFEEFIVFGKHLNFSRAADELFISQPSLSNHISAMERELGFELVRRGRPLEFTPAGKQFYMEVTQLLGTYHESVQRCKTIALRAAGKLVFERPIDTGGVTRYYEQELLEFVKARPHVGIREIVTDGQNLIDVLQNGEADIGVVFDRGQLDEFPQFNGVIDQVPLYGEIDFGRSVWLDRDHPLAAKQVVQFSDLAGANVLIPANARYQIVQHFLDHMSRRFGFRMNYVSHPGSLYESIMSVRPDEIEILGNDDLEKPLYNFHEHRVFRDLECPGLTLHPCFVFLRENDNPAVQVFREFALAFNAEHLRTFDY